MQQATNNILLLPQGESLSLAHSFFVPPLKVRRDWYEGLNPDPIDHSHPDVGTKSDAQMATDDQVNMPILHTNTNCIPHQLHAPANRALAITLCCFGNIEPHAIAPHSNDVPSQLWHTRFATV